MPGTEAGGSRGAIQASGAFACLGADEIPAMTAEGLWETFKVELLIH